MIYVYILILLIMLWANYIRSKSFISPSFLIVLMSILSCTIILFNNQRWGYPIGYKFGVFLILGLLSFSIGSFVFQGLNNSLCYERVVLNYADYKKASWIIYYPKTLLNIISLLLSLVFLYMILSKISFGGGLSDILRRVYLYNTSSEGSSGGNFIQNQVQDIVMAIGYMSVFAFLSKKQGNAEKKAEISILFPAFMHMVCTLVYTDRNILLRFSIYILVLWILFYKNKAGKTRKALNNEIIRKGIIIAAVFIVLFFVFGKLKQYKSNFVLSISIYGGSGFYNYSYYLENYFKPSKLEYGENIFFQIKNTLRFLGIFSGSSEVARHGQGFIWGQNGYGSNIYSALYNMTKDFGLAGVCIILFLESIWFEFLYNMTLKHGYGLSWIMYAALVYPVIYFPISDQFFNRLHLGILYENFWIIVVYYLVSKIRIRNMHGIQFRISSRKVFRIKSQ